MLASAGARHRTKIVSPKRQVEHDVAEFPRHGVAPHSVAGQELEIGIRAWFLATKVDRAIVKTPLERPSEGKTTRAQLNENVSMTNPQGVEQVASRKRVNMKCGGRGGIGSIHADVDSFAKIKGFSGDEEAGWPGQAERRRVKTGIFEVVKEIVGASLPNKNKVLVEQLQRGALSAPGVDLSIEISPCKLPEEGFQTAFEGDLEAQLDCRRSIRLQVLNDSTR